MIFRWRTAPEIFIYSHEPNGCKSIIRALKKTPGCAVGYINTLNRQYIASAMLRKHTKIPDHISYSDKILRHILPSRKKAYFITLISDDTSTWMEDEFKANTGIDPTLEGEDDFKIIDCAPAQFLILKDSISSIRKTNIIGQFLGKRIHAVQGDFSVSTIKQNIKSGDIRAPYQALHLYLPRPERLELLYQKLLAQNHLLHAPFSFTPQQSNVARTQNKIVLYNAHQSLPYHTSGYATRTQGLARSIQKAGWDIHVVTRAGYPLDTRIAPKAQHSQDNIPYAHDIRTGYGQWDLPLDAYIDTAADYLVTQARRIQPRLIHAASNYMCGMAGIEAARRYGVPSIYEMRGLWHVTRWSKEPDYAHTDHFALAQKLELETAAAATHVIAITGALKEWLIAQGIDAKKISVAPNAVDTKTFTPMPRDDAFAAQTHCAGKIVIGYIGSFVQYEGIDLLIRAFAALPAEMRARSQLLWVGDGPVLEDMLALAKELNVLSNITSLGRRPFEDVPRAYSIVDICAFPRKGQAICEIIAPLKPFEAMAMEKAVIVSDVRPLAEMITHTQTGLVHKKDSIEDLSRALALLIDNPDLRKDCGRRARKHVEETRQWDMIGKDVSAIYESLS